MSGTTRARFSLAGLLALVGLVALAGVAAADPEPAPKRKATPDKFARAAGEAFTEALAADQKGDLASAMGLYTKAFEISPHPATVYNMADVQRRLGQYRAAIKSYETYLVLAPRSPDVKDVEALIAKLVKTPGVLTVKTSRAADSNAISFKNAYVIIDGVIVKKPGVEPIPGDNPSMNFDLAPGIHMVDVVTQVSFGRNDCEVKPGERTECYVTAPPRTDGNVVISTDESYLNVIDAPRSQKDFENKRFERPIGKQRLLLRDRSFECPPLTFEIPANGDLAYVYLTTSEYGGQKRCRAIDIKRLKLHFD